MVRRQKSTADEAPEQAPARDAKKDRFIVLFRHGVAEPQDAGKPDEERSLTKEGNAEMKEIARGLAMVFPKADAIYTSPLVRAVQTALWISKGYRERLTVESTTALTPGATIDDLRAFLGRIADRRLILVGHEPNLSTNCMELAGIKASRGLDLKKGGCFGIRLDEEGHGSLEWMLTPKILRKF